MMNFLPPNTKIKYKKPVYEYDKDGMYIHIKDEVKTGYIFLVELEHDCIHYKVKFHLDSWGWDYVIPSQIIDILERVD